MKAEIRAAPPNSLILIEDAVGGEIPGFMGQGLVSATDSCVVVGCRSEDDGETEIVLGVREAVDVGGHPVFVGLVRTPSRRLVVRTALGATLLAMSVAETTTKLTIWANDTSEPDYVVVGVDSRL